MRNNEEFKSALLAALDAANGMRSEAIAKVIVEALEEEHRTIQQVFLGGVKLAIRRYADYARYDQRNEDAVKWAKQVAELENSDLPFRTI
jgi:hypothetical protein